MLGCKAFPMGQESWESLPLLTLMMAVARSPPGWSLGS